MIDDFMQELFTPDSFSDRFNALSGTRAMGFAPEGGRSPMMPPPQIPMPRARPDVMALMAGGPSGGGAMPSPQAPTLPGPRNIMPMLDGSAAQQSPQIDPQAARSIVGKLFGMNADREKRLRSSLASGFSGGDPAFAGGAFMKGAGGSLSGGLKSDKEDLDEGQEAQKTEFDQDMTRRRVVNTEKTGDALRKMYGVNTAAKAAGMDKRAWNKPASERYKEAQQLIINKNKEIDAQVGADNPLMPKADREAARTRAQTLKDAFRNETYKNMGLNPDGSGVDSTPSSGKVVGDKEGQDAGLYRKPGEKMLGAGTYDDPHMPESKEDFDQIPPGGYFMNPADGQIMRKKAQKTSALPGDDMAEVA